MSIGLGGATIGDLAVLSALRDHRPIPDALLRLVSYCIWGGLAILFVSGLDLFVIQPSLYLSSTGFIAKMLMVAALVINGLILHRRTKSVHFDPRFLLLGAVSVVSWYGSLVAAMFKSHLDLPVIAWIGLYLIAVAGTWWLIRALVQRWSRQEAHPSVSVEDGQAMV